MAYSVTSIKLGKMDNFIHFVTDIESRKTLVVDPAWCFSAIESHLHVNNMKLVGVILTHSHYDHISALDDVLLQYDVPTYITNAEYALDRFSIDSPQLVSDGEIIDIDGLKITVIETPGHTAGSACFLAEHHLICGDTLFVDGCGRCDFPDSNVGNMWDSLQKLKSFSDQTIIHAGHDYGQRPLSTLGEQKQTNPYLLLDDRNFFIEFRMSLQRHYRSIPFAPSSAAEMQSIMENHARMV